MSAVSLAIAAALVALRCQLISDDPYTLGSISRVLPATRPAFIRALNQTRRLIGCPVEGDVVEPDPIANPGQCVGVEYGTSGRRINPDGTVNSFWSNPCGNFRRGPITPRTFVDGPTKRYGYDYSNNSGQRLFSEIWTSGPDDDASITFDSIVRCDGGPDDCDQQVVYPPPVNINTNIDITYNIDDGTEVTVNAPFTFSPITVNFDGTLRIPFTFNLGGLEFSGDLNLPDFNLTLNPPALPPGSGEDLSPVGRTGREKP